MIFENSDRNDDSPKRFSESEYAFLNRSSSINSVRIRKFLEDFITRVPSKGVNDLVSRMRSGNKANFRSATFELFLHEALLRIGCELVVHPELDNGETTKPDFLVTSPEGTKFYLEAVLATERPEANESGKAIKGIVFDFLSTRPHKNFWVWIDDEGFPNSQPSCKNIVNEIHDWLDTLDPDEISNKLDCSNIYEESPSHEWTHEGWKINFRAIPIPNNKRGTSANLIGINSTESGGFVDSRSPIHDAIKHKGRKYGELDKPYLIAVNSISFFLDEIDEIEALFGTEQIVLGKDGLKFTRRMPNGAWRANRGAQYTRVSGVWLFNNLSPHTVSTCDQRLYFNPWAKHILPDEFNIFPHTIVEGNELHSIEGVSFAEICGLNDNQ